MPTNRDVVTEFAIDVRGHIKRLAYHCGGWVSWAGMAGTTDLEADWLVMADYAVGAGEYASEEARVQHAARILEICDKIADLFFSTPGVGSRECPPDWIDTEFGRLWWRASVRASGDDLISIRDAAKLAGVTEATIGQRIDRGALRVWIDPGATNPRKGRRLVSRRDVRRIWLEPWL